MSERYLGWVDIIKGVGELIVDETKLALHALFDSIHHEPRLTESEHYHGNRDVADVVSEG